MRAVLLWCGVAGVSHRFAFGWDGLGDTIGIFGLWF